MTRFSPKLSPNFSLAQLIHSDTANQHGLSNQPLPAHLPNLKRLAARLESVQRRLGHPLIITSAYRSPEVNRLVGGVPRSRHALGLAADIACPTFGAPIEVARALAASRIAFDQVILEYGRWVHFGLAPAGETPRRQLLTIRSGKEGYFDGLLETGAPAG